MRPGFWPARDACETRARGRADPAHRATRPHHRRRTPPSTPAAAAGFSRSSQARAVSCGHFTESDQQEPPMTEWSKITPDPILPALEPRAADPVAAPSAAPTAPATPTPTTTDRRASSRGVRSVIGASVLAAVLASASTVGILSATRPAPATAPAETPAAVPATKIITDADLPNVVEAARKSVVTITADGVSAGGFPFNIPATGVGSGVILTEDGYVLTN